MSKSGYHRPVLVEEVVTALEPGSDGEVMDGTVGGGGHARALLERYPRCRVLAVDRDPEALEAAREALAEFGERVRFVKARFDEAARGAGIAGPSLAGALLDLGVSSHQLDQEDRGFSFREEAAPLDMRMGGAEGEGPSAAEVLNERTEEELARLLHEYGEEPRARRLAREVVRSRRERPLRTAGDLVGAMARAYGRAPMSKEKARVFQALRIEVNDELRALEEGLPVLRETLLPGGVMVVISYHSLEDRRVKNAFREWSRECVCPPGMPMCTCRGRALGETITRRVVRPGQDEVEANPRARSARMRAWRKAA
jgi:16S rRNA (cytosine1402-N4)-methyltransferase